MFSTLLQRSNKVINGLFKGHAFHKKDHSAGFSNNENTPPDCKSTPTAVNTLLNVHISRRFTDLRGSLIMPLEMENKDLQMG